jgi:hypothetical protein
MVASVTGARNENGGGVFETWRAQACLFGIGEAWPVHSEITRLESLTFEHMSELRRRLKSEQHSAESEDLDAYSKTLPRLQAAAGTYCEHAVSKLRNKWYAARTFEP